MVEPQTSASEDGKDLPEDSLKFFLLRYGSKIDYLKTNGTFVMSVMEPACESQCLHLFFLEKFDKILKSKPWKHLRGLFPATISRRPKLSVEAPFFRGSAYS